MELRKAPERAAGRAGSTTRPAAPTGRRAAGRRPGQRHRKPPSSRARQIWVRVDPRARHAPDDPRDLLDVGQPAAPESDQLVEHEHGAAAEANDPHGPRRLSDRPALRERGRARRTRSRGFPRSSSRSRARSPERCTASPNRAPKRRSTLRRCRTSGARPTTRPTQTLVRIVDGGGPRVQIQGGTVSLNLRQIVADLANRLGLPSSVAEKLPASVASLKVVTSEARAGAQHGQSAARAGRVADDHRAGALRAGDLPGPRSTAGGRSCGSA